MEKIILPKIATVGDLIDFLKSDFKVSDLTVRQIRFIGYKISRYLFKIGEFDDLTDIPYKPHKSLVYRYFIKGSVYRFYHPDSVFKFLINVSCYEKTEGFFDELEKYQFADGSILSRETRL